MGHIVSESEAAKISSKLKKEGKKIVVTGGCFDILHIGHIRLLEKAKKEGDILFVLLENDENIKNKKGFLRPINNERERAEILSSILWVDYVVLLSGKKNNQKYDKLLLELSPHIIATTKGDKNIHHKKRQARLIDAKLIEVIKEIKNKSTSRIAKIIKNQHL